MYEAYTKQSLPTKEYLELVGAALCVFNSNNAFMIENIIKTDDSYDWYDLMDKESGRLKNYISKTISQNSNDEICELFSEIVEMRNRIIHSRNYYKVLYILANITSIILAILSLLLLLVVLPIGIISSALTVFIFLVGKEGKKIYLNYDQLNKE